MKKDRGSQREPPPRLDLIVQDELIRSLDELASATNVSRATATRYCLMLALEVLGAAAPDSAEDVKPTLSQGPFARKNQETP